MRRWLTWLVRFALLALAIALPGGTAHAQVDAPEYVVKSAYLYKLGDYIQWPAEAFEAAASPINICIADDDPFGNALDTSIAGKMIAGRPILVRRLKSVEHGNGCHILYFGSSDAHRIAQELDAVRGSPVLTVTDEARSNITGIIHFVVKDRRVRFDIDDGAAAANGLKISSKLFTLALSVKPRT
jgi:hypothetical protein